METNVLFGRDEQELFIGLSNLFEREITDEKTLHDFLDAYEQDVNEMITVGFDRYDIPWIQEKVDMSA